MSKSITSAQLAAKENDDSIQCVGGTLTQLRDRKTGSGQHGEWSLQGGSLKLEDGKFHDITFKDMEDMSGWKNRYIHIESHQKEKGGMSGIKMKQKEKNGKTYREIWVTSSANISGDVAEDSGSRHEASQPTEPPRRQPPPPEAPKDIIGRIKGDIYNRLNILALVKAGYEACQEQLQLPPGPSLSELLTISGAVNMSVLKQDWMPRVRFSSGTTEAELKQQPEQSWGEDDTEAPGQPAKKTTTVRTWRDAIDPKTGKKLPDAPTERRLVLAGWALDSDIADFAGEEPENVTARQMIADVRMMCAEMGWDNTKVFEMRLSRTDEMQTERFSDADYERFKEEHDPSAYCDNIEGALEILLEYAKEREAAAKPKAAPSSKPKKQLPV